MSNGCRQASAAISDTILLFESVAKDAGSELIASSTAVMCLVPQRWIVQTQPADLDGLRKFDLEG